MNETTLFDINDVTSSRRILHTPSEYARKNLVFAQEAGYLKSLKPHSSSRNNLDSYLFFVVTKGDGQVKYEGKTYDVKNNDCVFIDCRKPYEHISNEENPWELKWVHMDGGILADFYSVFFEKNNNSPVLNTKNAEKYCTLLDEVMTIQDDKDVTSEYVTNSLLVSLATQVVVEVINAGNVMLNPNMLNSIRESVNLNFKEENLLETICREYSIDEIEVNKQFKDKYGIDLCDYILNRRFTCAKELLRFTVKPVKDVVVESGIMNSDLFRHLFIENEGMTAEEYRKKWAAWNRG